MKLFKKFFTFFLFTSIAFGYSQAPKKEPIKKEVPVSIYTATQISTDLNSVFNINKRLNLKSYQFLVLFEKDIEMGNFTVPISNLRLAKSDYVYDSYIKNHKKSVLESAFFKVSDLYIPRTKNPL